MTGFRIVIPADLSKVAIVTEGIARLCAGRTAERILHDVQIATTEALTNLVRHGYCREPYALIGVDVALEAQKLVIEIADTAPPFDVAKAAMVSGKGFRFDETDVPTLPESGMGLAIIYKTVDHIEYSTEDGQNRLRLEKRID